MVRLPRILHRGPKREPKKYKPRRDLKKTRKKIIDRTIATAIATDPKVEREWILKTYGIDIGSEKENDPTAQMAAKLREKWTAEALEKLGKDEKSQKSAIRALVNEIKKNNAASGRLRDEGEPDHKETDEQVRSKSNSAKRNLRRDMIKQFTEKGKTNRPATDDNTDELTRLFSELAKTVSSAGTGGSSNRIIAVQIDGEFVEMSPEAYEIFKNQREELLDARARSKDLNKQSPDSKASLSE
jgi:hypothetical protein